MEFVTNPMEYANVSVVGQPRTGMVMLASGVIVDFERLDRRRRVLANRPASDMEFVLDRQLIGKN